MTIKKENKHRNPVIGSRGRVVINKDSKTGQMNISHVEDEYTFAFELQQSARVMRMNAKQIEDGPTTHWQLRAYIHGAIILSYAYLEAALNEIIHLYAIDPKNSLTATEREIFKIIGSEDLHPRGKNTLEKYNIFLRILGKSTMAVGSSPYQPTNLVRILRNMIVHPIPGRVVSYTDDDQFDYSSQQDIVKKLRSHLSLGKNAIFPNDVITKDCAEWAVRACEGFFHEFISVSGIEPGFVTDPSR